jgi:hypothetical protein
MLTELLPRTRNVVRLPVELRERPTMELLRELAAGVRWVGSIIEVFDSEMPAFDLSHQVECRQPLLARSVRRGRVAISGPQTE